MLRAAVLCHMVAAAVHGRRRRFRALVSGLAAAFLFQHHSTPLRSRVLEPHLRKQIKQIYLIAVNATLASVIADPLFCQQVPFYA